MPALVILKTRVPRRTMREFAKLAERNERSVAAELRLIVDRHLSEAPNQEGGKP